MPPKDGIFKLFLNKMILTTIWIMMRKWLARQSMPRPLDPLIILYLEMLPPLTNQMSLISLHPGDPSALSIKP